MLWYEFSLVTVTTQHRRDATTTKKLHIMQRPISIPTRIFPTTANFRKLKSPIYLPTWRSGEYHRRLVLLLHWNNKKLSCPINHQQCMRESFIIQLAQQQSGLLHSASRVRFPWGTILDFNKLIFLDLVVRMQILVQM